MRTCVWAFVFKSVTESQRERQRERERMPVRAFVGIDFDVSF